MGGSLYQTRQDTRKRLENFERHRRRQYAPPRFGQPGGSKWTEGQQAHQRAMALEALKQREQTRRARMGNETTLDAQFLQNQGSYDVQGLRNRGQLDVQALRNQGWMDSQRLENQGMLDRTHATGAAAHDREMSKLSEQARRDMIRSYIEMYKADRSGGHLGGPEPKSHGELWNLVKSLERLAGPAAPAAAPSVGGAAAPTVPASGGWKPPEGVAAPPVPTDALFRSNNVRVQGKGGRMIPAGEYVRQRAGGTSRPAAKPKASRAKPRKTSAAPRSQAPPRQVSTRVPFGRESRGKEQLRHRQPDKQQIPVRRRAPGNGPVAAAGSGTSAFDFGNLRRYNRRTSNPTDAGGMDSLRRVTRNRGTLARVAANTGRLRGEPSPDKRRKRRMIAAR